MAGEKDAGSIVYTVSADIEPLLVGGKLAADALDKLDAAAKASSKGMDGLDNSTEQAGGAFTELTGYANSMDNQLKKLNSSVSGIARAMAEARSGTGGASNEFSRADSIIEALGNQLAILDEAQENGARSAAMLAAQLRAGSKATDEEKQKIGELTGRLFDMKTASDTGAKGHGNWKSTMQQAGYQVQDFIVQVQGGQSALVAFSQQGSQLAGAFGPGGAVIGAVLALSTVVAGALITSLNGGKNAMDALKSAAETMDKVITISQNGVAALSDKYAALAQTNIAVATLMKKQAELELQAALSNVSKEVQKASSDFISFGDSLMSSLGGGYASVKLFNDYLSTLNITTNDFSEAWKQATASGQAGQSTMNSMVATVAALSTKFDISDQKAFEFAKQLSDIAKTPTDEKLKALVVTLQDVGNGQSSGAAKAREYAKSLLTIMETSTDATSRLKALKEMTDSLTSSQDKALKIAQQELFIARQTGEAQMKAKAWRDAETQGLKEGTEAFRKYYNVKLATYKQDEANANSKKGAKSAASDANKLASQQETVAQKLANLKQQSELAAASTNELSREQAMLRAEQSLGSAASQAQIKEAREYAARTWDVANALKMRQQAEQASRFINQEVAASKVQRDPYTGEAQDPAAQVKEEEQRKLEALAKYRELGVINAQQYEDGKTAIARQASNDRISIAQQEAKRQVDVMNTLLGGIGEGFSGLAEIVSKSAGESNAAYKTLFAISKAFAVAQSTLNLQLALSNAMASGPFPWNMAAMAQVAAAGGQVISSIGAMSYGGGREHGGPVSASSMYRVGEGGKPEIFKASNGSQYMIPGDNGRVISNRDIGGGGGGFNYSPTIQINGNPDEKTIALVEAAVARGGKQVYQQISGDLASGKGNVSKGLQSGWTAKRRIG
ncbi:MULTISPECIES: tail protein (tape measure) [Citrobacter freundii complex]|uniref:tail protein (tape measure) n=1 Tax=Citrobacter freundii complex TaxID=1344959 RepID=UPI000CDC9622|nr:MULTISPECIES: tail protein (tape measure) [Citrobacter freundii complex]AUZ69839.1 tail protein (tape measure) [Citrobacter freundii complex sp. CFNIH4]POU14058.1 tail protein (tape measure) [Citrobacter freundii complex sp. CFNIH6]POU15804.1 tail protein (tape measure) [Citrobacter freundii complex sp. CFNIH7]QLR82520.1 tail protein (tape measure) [Citrobacter freundii]HCB1465091.1 tail protein (tape measure) [Citrobacter freundii]